MAKHSRDAGSSDGTNRDVRDRVFREQLAAEFRAEAARRRLSARKIAKELGESPRWTQRRFSAETAMNTDDLGRIARVMGVSLRELMMQAMDHTDPEITPSRNRREDDHRA